LPIIAASPIFCLIRRFISVSCQTHHLSNINHFLNLFQLIFDTFSNFHFLIVGSQPFGQKLFG
jgi:hypothetical protein